MNTQEKEPPKPVTPERLAEDAGPARDPIFDDEAFIIRADEWMIRVGGNIMAATFNSKGAAEAGIATAKRRAQSSIVNCASSEARERHSAAERNAGIAQARDLAEEALKRHGFELGVVNDVVTWVTKKPFVSAEKIMSDDGVFKGASGLRRLYECNAYWQGRPYGTRLYFEDSGDGYLHRDVLGSAVACLERQAAAISALKTAAADYAKAAEASAALVEKLKRERDALRDTPSPVIAALENERDTLRADLSAAREEERSTVASWHKMREERDAANEAREKEKRNHKALSQYLRAGSLDVDAYLGVYDERDSLKAALEKERAEVAQLKQHLSNQCDDLRQQLAKANASATRHEHNWQVAEVELKHEREGYMRLLAQWQAVAGKKDAALKFAAETFREYESLHNAKGTNEGALKAITNKNYAVLCEDALSTPPSTALIEALEEVFNEATEPSYSYKWSDAEKSAHKKRSWLASSTCKRHSGGTEAGA